MKPTPRALQVHLTDTPDLVIAPIKGSSGRSN